MHPYLDKAGFAAFCGLLLAVGYVEGLFSVTLSLDFSVIAIAVGMLKAKLDVLGFAVFLAVSGGLYFLYYLRSTANNVVREGPRFSAIVPVYGDAEVLHRSVESLRESAYDPLEVLVVYESDDHETATVAKDLAATYDDVRAIVNEYAGTKAGAINHALEVTDGEYVGVFDADELVDPEFVPHAIGDLEADADLDVVQGRTVPEPGGLVESMAYYESVLMNFALIRIAYLLTGFRLAASRCVVLRREALLSLGGYDPDMLTEDFAFTYDCYKERIEVSETLEHPSRIDAAHTFTDWWGQRKRWMTGYTQVLHHQLTELRPISDYRNLLSLVISFSTVAGSIFLVTLLSKFAILLFVGAAVSFLAPIAIIYGICLGAHLLDYRQGTVGLPSWHFLLVPIVLPVYSLAAVKAMVEYVFGWDGDWYRVTKEA